MSQSIPELAKALRDAASAIEQAAKFSFKENVDIAEIVGILRSVKKKHQEISFIIDIEIVDKTETIEYEIRESYTSKAKAPTVEGCMEIYLASKEGQSSLASLSRLIKSAVKAEEKEQAALAVVN